MKSFLILTSIGVVILVVAFFVHFFVYEKKQDANERHDERDSASTTPPPQPMTTTSHEYSPPDESTLVFSETDSGLRYAVISEGDGRRPNTSDRVRVHYHGTLDTGEVFDSSYRRGESIVFPLTGLIAGWQEGIPLMTVGSQYRFIIPPELAYGPAGSGHPLGGKTLTFDIELLDILP